MQAQREILRSLRLSLNDGTPTCARPLLLRRARFASFFVESSAANDIFACGEEDETPKHHDDTNFWQSE